VKILFLYAEVMGYTMATLKALSSQGVESHVVHWDKSKLTPYRAPDVDNIYFYSRSAQDIRTLSSLAEQINPSIIFVSGWADHLYLVFSREMCSKGRTVISGFDAQWRGTLKQQFAALLSRFHFFFMFYSHAWVAGASQYEYVRRLGFRPHQIIFNLYSAEVYVFHAAYHDSISIKRKSYPHRFLFVGRLERVKGLDVLLKAWRILGEEQSDWELHLIGNGSLNKYFCSISGITVKSFMSEAELAYEASAAGCFVLPSRLEPWGVVVHEFAAAGLPLILSDAVGARTAFLVSGWNGYCFRAGDPIQLASFMRKVIHSADSQLISMGDKSYNLSHRITPELSAASLLSIVDRS